MRRSARLPAGLLITLPIFGCSTSLVDPCEQLQAQVSTIVGAPQPCVMDAGCIAQGMGCGMSPPCTVYVTSASSAVLKPLVEKWHDLACDQRGAACSPCPVPRPAACVRGACEALP